MKINADLSQRVAIDTEALPWVVSPLPGVERRMLERDGEEVARATSLVRYAPASHFSPHTHGGGEEFLVLDGVFSDEHGDYGPGLYVRNPPCSSHTPRSDEGCTILVKLWQMDPEDAAFVRTDTADDARFLNGDIAGEAILPLYERGAEVVRCLRWATNAALGTRTYPGGAEVFVIEGGFEDEHGRYGKWSWLRLPPGSAHTPRSSEGARLLIKTGHLADPPRGPRAS